MDLQLEFSHVDARCALPFQKNTSTAAIPRRCFRTETANFTVEACCSSLHPGVHVTMLLPLHCSIHFVRVAPDGPCPPDLLAKRRIQLHQRFFFRATAKLNGSVSCS